VGVREGDIIKIRSIKGYTHQGSIETRGACHPSVLLGVGEVPRYENQCTGSESGNGGETPTQLLTHKGWSRLGGKARKAMYPLT